MIENRGHDQLAAFAGTPGWGGLTVEEVSLFVAYLRRTEDWSITAFLRAIGREATIAANALRPPPAQAAAMPVPAPPPAPPGPVPTPYPNFGAAAAPFDPTAGVVPPNFEELAAMREAADRAFKRDNRQRSAAGSSGAGSGAAVALTAQEIQTATMLGRRWSAENSGHGRESHGSYASSSSPHTADRDRMRSEQAAIQREIEKALKRKCKTGNAFSN